MQEKPSLAAAPATTPEWLRLVRSKNVQVIAAQGVSYEDSERLISELSALENGLMKSRPKDLQDLALKAGYLLGQPEQRKEWDKWLALDILRLAGKLPYASFLTIFPALEIQHRPVQ